MGEVRPIILDRAISKLKNFLGAFRTLSALSEAVEGIKRLERHKENLDREVARVVEVAASRVDSLRKEEALLVSNLIRLREETVAAEKLLDEIRMGTRSI